MYSTPHVACPGAGKQTYLATNFCLQALIKVQNFRNARNKAAYLYKLTPSGIEEKARVTKDFLKRKLAEYQTIQQEIAELQADLAAKPQKD